MTESKLFEAVKGGNVPAIMFVMKTIGKDRGYVERIKQEISGPDGEVIKVKLTDD